MQQGSLD